jgi:hypothetical protein
MDHETSRLIKDEKRFIFMEDVKRNRFWLYIKWLRARDDQHNPVTGFHLVTGLHYLAINSDVPVFD